MVKVDKVWITDKGVFILTVDGKEASERIADYPRLANASAGALNNYEVDDFGIYWPDLDEDLSFEGFFKQKSDNPLYDLFMNHPELNASAIARRMGFSQCLLAQYISGAKKPSAERLNAILAEIRSIGIQLSNVGV